MADADDSRQAGALAPDERTSVTRAVPAGEETTAVVDAGEETTAARPAPAHRPTRLRGALLVVLIALSCLAVVVTGLTWWGHHTLMDADGFMQVVAPIGKDPEKIRSLSAYVSDQVVQATALEQRLAEALPTRLRVLAGPIAGYAEDVIAKGTVKVLSSPEAYGLWLKVVEAGHQQVVAMLRGESTAAYVRGSDVKLNTLPLVSRVLLWVSERLPDVLSDRVNPPVIEPGTDPQAGIQELANWSGRPLPSDFGQITLLQSDALGPLQVAVKWFDRLVWILPLVTATLIATTVWLSRRRTRTAMAIGVGAAIAIFVTRVIVARLSEYLTTRLEQGTVADLVRDIVDRSLRPLTTLTIWICVVGLVAAVLVWLLGRRDVRAGLVAAGKRATGQAVEVRIPDSPVTSWIVDHAPVVRWGVVVVGLIVLALTTSSWLGIILTIVVVLLLQGVLSLIVGQWPFAGPEDGGTTRA
ncbi:MAG TPA: hypothetical protein PLJ89_05815 [Thermoleophilia bacterium]|nr:hypothetical protein [Thermoleophilia bacterium]